MTVPIPTADLTPPPVGEPINTNDVLELGTVWDTRSKSSEFRERFLDDTIKPLIQRIWKAMTGDDPTPKPGQKVPFIVAQRSTSANKPLTFLIDDYVLKGPFTKQPNMQHYAQLSNAAQKDPFLQDQFIPASPLSIVCAVEVTEGKKTKTHWLRTHWVVSPRVGPPPSSVRMETVYDFKPPAAVEAFYDTWGQGKKEGTKRVVWWRAVRDSTPVDSDAARDFEFIRDVIAPLKPTTPSGGYDIPYGAMERLSRMFKAGILAWTLGIGDAGPHNMLNGRLVDCFDNRGQRFYDEAKCFFDLLHSRGQYAAKDKMGPLTFAAKSLLPTILEWTKRLKTTVPVTNVDSAIAILESGRVTPAPKPSKKRGVAK